MVQASKVVRGGFWLYGSSVVNNVLGFLYWFIISRIGGSNVLGLTSTVIGFSSLVTGLIGLGVPIGLQRFLGREYKRSKEGLSIYFWSSAAFLFLIHSLAALLLFMLGVSGFSFYGFDPGMLCISSLIVFLGFCSSFSSYLISMLRTDVLFVANLFGNILKLITGVTLVFLGFGWVGAVLGYVFIRLSILFAGLYYVNKTIGLRPYLNLGVILEVLVASIASWLPNMVILAGQWVGVLVVFGSSGAVETGYYYVAFVLANFVLMIGVSMLRLLLPVLSGLEDGRKRASYGVFRFSLGLVSPIALAVMVYPWVPLGLLGGEYISASGILFVLLLSAFPLLLSQAVYSLVYAYGWYRDVLLIGLFQNVPRLILYFWLVPLYGGLGAAVAYTVGAYTGLLYVGYLIHRMKYYVDWRSVGLTIGVPALIALLAYLLKLHWLMGGPAILSSYLIYLRLRVMTRNDLKTLLGAFLPQEKLREIYSKFKPLVDFIAPM